MKWLLTISLIVLTAQLSCAQVKSWRFDQLDSLQKVEARDVMVFLTADWCKYCKTMERKVFSDQSVGEKINDDYWFIQFNGESQETITFRGEEYNFRPTGLDIGVHELAEAIASVDGEVSYPTLVVIQPSGDITFQHGGFLNKKSMVMILDQLALAAKY